MKLLNKNNLFIIRGISGSGKSTLANLLSSLVSSGKTVAADDWFDIYTEGVWQFEKLGVAHEWCRNKTKELLQEGHDVFVHNTFVKQTEVNLYINIAQELDISYHILIADGDYQNIHKVPDHKNTQRAKDFWFNNRFMRRSNG